MNLKIIEEKQTNNELAKNLITWSVNRKIKCVKPNEKQISMYNYRILLIQMIYLQNKIKQTNLLKITFRVK